MSGLDRFLDAQAGIYPQALAEIRSGAKTGHWMWFVFPQIVGLGHSAMARTYGIGSLAEARDYLRHPVLGARLRECARAIPGRSAERVFGPVDAMKLRSSMTLFAAAGDADDPFAAVIDRLCDGVADAATLRMLKAGDG